MEVTDEDEDVGAGVGAADADVVEAAVVSEGDDPGFVDLVVADSVVVGIVSRARGGALTDGPLRRS